jgi:putative ABC transport system permease protein
VRLTALGRAGTTAPAGRQWLAGWRVGLRMAWRDVRRYRWRSLLVIVMVGLPVMLLVGGLVWGSSGQFTPMARLVFQMGNGQALIHGPDPSAIQQLPDGLGVYGNPGEQPPPARHIPGWMEDKTNADNSTAVEDLLGGTAIPVAQGDVRVLKEDRRIPATVLYVDGSAGLGDKARLTSGRWPADDGEIAVTPLGIEHGLPSTGSVTVSIGQHKRTVTVVGEADALNESGGMVDLVTPQVWSDEYVYSPGWILQRDAPVTWAEVEQLNQYGLTVVSREAVTHPPATSELPAGVQAQEDWQARQTRQLALVASVLLFIVTTLLVAPAFAVSASRQRRALALAAMNGARAAQLRRVMLYQGLILGGVSAVVGAVLGCGAVWAAIRAWRLVHPWTSIRGYVIPWSAVALVTLVAIVSTLIAAVLPTLRLGRLDIVGAMRGHSTPPRPNRIVPAVGVTLAGVGGVGLFRRISEGASEPGGYGDLALAVAIAALILGALMIVPLLLVVIAGVAARLPVALRMATRDAARHRSRTVPTVAALMAGVAVLTIGAIATSSDTQQQRQDYSASAPVGQAVVYFDHHQDPRGSETRQTVTEADSALRTVLVESVGSREVSPGQEATASPFVEVVPPGCTEQQTTHPPHTWGTDGPPPCAGVGTMSWASRSEIQAMPAGAIIARLHLVGQQARTVRDGGLVVMDHLAPTGQTVTVLTGTYAPDPMKAGGGDTKITARTTVPVVALTDAQIRDGLLGTSAGAYVATESAEERGWPLTPRQLTVVDPDGPISHETEQRVQESLDQSAWLYVERGFQSRDALFLAIILGIAIALLVTVTLVSTALALAEQQADHATLAAVGATRGTRRRMAAAQAFTLSVVALVVGLAVGLVPGIALTYPLTATRWDGVTGRQVIGDPTVVIPWLDLGAVLIGVPLLAAALSAAAVRRAPELTRRAT